jgi:hypothetical protein
VRGTPPRQHPLIALYGNFRWTEVVQLFGWNKALAEVFSVFDPLIIFKQEIWHEHIASSTLIGVQWDIRNPDAIPGRIRHVDSPRIAKALPEDVVRIADRRSMKDVHVAPIIRLPYHGTAEQRRKCEGWDCNGFGLPAKNSQQAGVMAVVVGNESRAKVCSVLTPFRAARARWSAERGTLSTSAASRCDRWAVRVRSSSVTRCGHRPSRLPSRRARAMPA